MSSDLLESPLAAPITTVRDAADFSARLSDETSRTARRRATLALLIACLVWGGSFTWAKAAIAATNAHAGQNPHSILGPLLLIAWRFLLAGIAWLAIFPKSRRGWSWRTLGRSIL